MIFILAKSSIVSNNGVINMLQKISPLLDLPRRPAIFASIITSKT